MNIIANTTRVAMRPIGIPYISHYETPSIQMVSSLSTTFIMPFDVSLIEVCLNISNWLLCDRLNNSFYNFNED